MFGFKQNFGLKQNLKKKENIKNGFSIPKKKHFRLIRDSKGGTGTVPKTTQIATYFTLPGPLLTMFLHHLQNVGLCLSFNVLRGRT